MRLHTIRELKNIKGKRVLARVDFNIGIKNGGVPKNELTRIKSSLKIIDWLIKRKAKVILATHLGRPDGKFDAKFSVTPLRPAIEKLLGSKIKLAKDVIGSDVLGLSNDLREGEVLLLENVRFYKEEESNDSKFAKELSKLADIYVNDAFAVSHRLHASVSAITKFLPSFAGFLLEDEVKNLSRLLVNPKKPFVVLMGGVKIETKMPVIKHLLPLADKILIGGALANVIKTQKGKLDRKIILPVDYKIEGDKAMDIGPKTIKLFGEFIEEANTIVWNGPLGVVERSKFAIGTKKIAASIARRAHGAPFVVVGGGDTLPIIEALRNKEDIDFVSTGGGAMLEFLGGKILPGIKPLLK